MALQILKDYSGRLRRWRGRGKLARQISRIERYLLPQASARAVESAPVLFFDASARINYVSQNAAFSLFASWAIRLKGVPVRRMVCHRGLLQCMLGTNRQDLAQPPPCALCLRMSRILHPEERTIRLNLDPQLRKRVGPELEGLTVGELSTWEYEGYRLGELCLPSLRWSLRRHNLPDEEPLREHFRRYLLSAASLLGAIRSVIDEIKPRHLVVFNGVAFPEALARQVCISKGIPVVTHEVGLRSFSAFFSHGLATAYPIDLPERGMSREEEEQLDAYLESRFHGQFSMAGIRFWPEMQPIRQSLRQKLARFKQTVMVFTNVIFDTSQQHANVLFQDMFDWLEELAGIIMDHPETLFIIRAHPDEQRPGKESQESVAQWVRHSGLVELPNVAFLGPTDLVSSYELIRRAKLVLIYNSTIGLEASILGAPVLCAGRARFTRVPTVFFPESRQAYGEMLRGFLSSQSIRIPGEFKTNARRFLHYQLFRTSLDFSAYLRGDPDIPGGVLLRDFDPVELEPDRSPEMAAIARGILEGKPFVYEGPALQPGHRRPSSKD